MEVRYLKEFVELAQVRNYREAAGRLYMSQSSLTKHIQILEREMGAMLFERDRHSVCLSEAGSAFLPCAQRIVDEYETGLQILNQLMAKKQQQLRLVTNYNVLNPVTVFQQEYPGYQIELREMEWSDGLKLLCDGSCDLGIFSDPEKRTGLSEEFLYMENIAAVLPAHHPLAGRKAIQLSELKNETFVSAMGKDCQEECLEMCRNAGFVPRIGILGNRGQDVVNYIRNGMGVGLLYGQAVIAMKMKGVAVVAIEPAKYMRICAVYRTAPALSLPTQQFLKFIHAMFSAA